MTREFIYEVYLKIVNCYKKSSVEDADKVHLELLKLSIEDQYFLVKALKEAENEISPKDRNVLFEFAGLLRETQTGKKIFLDALEKFQTVVVIGDKECDGFTMIDTMEELPEQYLLCKEVAKEVLLRSF